MRSWSRYKGSRDGACVREKKRNFKNKSGIGEERCQKLEIVGGEDIQKEKEVEKKRKEKKKKRKRNTKRQRRGEVPGARGSRCAKVRVPPAGAGGRCSRCCRSSIILHDVILYCFVSRSSLDQQDYCRLVGVVQISISVI